MKHAASHQLRVGIAGVGNNASAIAQGVHYYGTPEGVEAARRGEHGIRFPTLCGYDISDIVFSCAFDVDERKIDLDLGEAIFCAPNCYPTVVSRPLLTGAIVHPAPVLDGVPGFLSEMISVSPSARRADTEADLELCARLLRETDTHVLVNFLPSGSDQATEFFARAAAAGGAAYVNCTPASAVHSAEIVELFETAGLPILGDDLESQFGSSLIHRTVLEALEQRGLQLLSSYQINLGGNTDFKNLYHRPEAKRASKMKSLNAGLSGGNVDVIPSAGYLRGLLDHKIGYISVEGRGWLNMPVTVDIKLRVQDSSNAAGVTIDLIRLARGALDRGLRGYAPFPFYFKNPQGEKPPTQDALQMIELFDRDGSR